MKLKKLIILMVPYALGVICMFVSLLLNSDHYITLDNDGLSYLGLGLILGVLISNFYELKNLTPE